MSDASTTNAIDLSQLPAPEVIETLSYEAILAEILAPVLDAFPEFDIADDSDPAVKILQVAAFREMLIRQRVNDAARATMLAYAVGADLENLGANLRVEKLTGETDDAYRERIVLAPDGYSVAGPESAYVFHARSAHADVADATATSPAPCEVAVTVLSKSGDGIPDSDVLDAVAAAVNARTIRPLTDQVTVQAATMIDYEIAAQIWTYAGPDSAVVIAAATARVTAYAAAVRKLGRDPTFSGVIAALHVEGVQRVVLLYPDADIPIDGTECGNCTGIMVDHMGIGE